MVVRERSAMSSTLIWEPLNRKKKDLPDEIKYILRKKYGEPINIVLRENDIGYLQGIKDAGVLSIEILINAIEKYQEILVQEEW